MSLICNVSKHNHFLRPIRKFDYSFCHNEHSMQAFAVSFLAEGLIKLAYYENRNNYNAGGSDALEAAICFLLNCLYKHIYLL